MQCSKRFAVANNKKRRIDGENVNFNSHYRAVFESTHIPID